MNQTSLPQAFAFVALLIASAFIVGAQAREPLAPDVATGEAHGPAESVRGVAADLGTGWNILSIPAAAFGVRASSDQFDYLGNGYIHPGATGADFWAPILLPSGAGIGYLGLYAFDVDATSNVGATIRRFTGYGTRPCFIAPLCPPPVLPTFDDVATVASSGSGGYRYVESGLVNPLHTVNNNTAWGDGAQYTIIVSAGAAGPSLGFKGVDIWWKRQISPAPGAASFTDVPMGAQFFAEVEAMKASGITGGCTATAFCPDSAVTRRQMAAFLSRALGLYWQY